MPDSGADISAAGEEILAHLNEHIDNLLPSTTVPKAANGTEMHPVGKLLICLKLGNTEFSDDPHIYPDVCGILISSCKQCQDHLPSNPKEPIIQKPQPARPFQEIAVDLCSYAGRTYLVIVDCLTDWPAVISLDYGTTSQQVIVAIRQSFCRTAIPDVVWSDGGPQFTSKQFNDFASRWGFRHIVSSPCYPQSNGKVPSHKLLLGGGGGGGGRDVG